MSIEFVKLDDVYTVKKPWGYEKWIANGNPNFCAMVWQYNKSVPGNPSAIMHIASIFLGCKKNDMMLLSSPPDNEILCESHSETDSSKI